MKAAGEVDTELAASDAAPTILIVEDEILIRLMVAEELRSHGLAVVEAANADEAMTILESSVPLHLVFTDVRMPGSMDGLTFAARVRSVRPKLKIIVASGHSPKSEAQLIADTFFSKPYSVDALEANQIPVRHQ